MRMVPVLVVPAGCSGGGGVFRNAAFKREAKRSQRLSDEDLEASDWNLMMHLGLTNGDKLTRAAVLLFHRNPEKWFVGAYTKIGMFDGAEIRYMDEVDSVKSQIVTSPNSHFFSGQEGGRRKPPYAFTEQGIYMLATVLKGDLAEQQSIFIMRAFRQMRLIIEENRQIFNSSELINAQISALVEKNAKLEKRQNETDADIQIIQNRIDTLNQNFISDENIKAIVIYKNQKYEADNAYIEIFASARKSIYLIDDYIGNKTLQLLTHKRKGVDVILFSENKGSKTGKVTKVEIEDFNNEYPHLVLLPNKESHDRFIILDYNEKTERIYHCGASIKDSGSKVCGINQIQETLVLHPVIDQLLSR